MRPFLSFPITTAHLSPDESFALVSSSVSRIRNPSKDTAGSGATTGENDAHSGNNGGVGDKDDEDGVSSSPHVCSPVRPVVYTSESEYDICHRCTYGRKLVICGF